MAYSTRKLSLVSEQEPPAEHETAISDGSRPLGTVAATLRAARLAHGSTLPEIADALRIRLGYLEAIEDGRFDELPGAVYAIGFIRTYADHLGLDSRHLIEKFKEESAEPEEEKRELHFLAAEPDRRIPGGSLMLVALLVATVTYGVWFYVSSTDRTLVDLIPDFPDRFNALLQSDPAPSDDIALATPSEPAGELVAADPVQAPTESVLIEDTFGSPIPEAPESVEEVAEVSEPFAPIEPAGTEFEPVPFDESAAGGAGDGFGAEGFTATPETAPNTNGAFPGVEDSTFPSVETPNADALDVIAPADDEVFAPTETVDAFAPTVPEAAVEESTETAALPEVSPSDLDATDRPAGQSAAIAAARAPGPPDSPTFGGENEDSRVLINATAMSWVQVRDDAGNLVMTRVLQPGESYRVPNRPGLQMVTGNAGGIEIFVDGQPTPAFGRVGDVVRNVDLNPDALLNGTAVPN